MKMNKTVIMGVIIGLLIVGGGTVALLGSQNNKDAEKLAMKKEAVVTTEESAKDDAMKKDETSEDVDVMKVAGSFVAYDEAKLANAEKGEVVLFFSAPWCPTCQEANKNFNASSAPDGLTLLKLDYDSSTELKKKYGVTYQHTFVQVDKDGKLLKKWSGSSTYSQITQETI